MSIELKRLEKGYAFSAFLDKKIFSISKVLDNIFLKLYVVYKKHVKKHAKCIEKMRSIFCANCATCIKIARNAIRNAIFALE